MMRLILDTNILLSALLSPASVPAKLLELESEIILFVSKAAGDTATVVDFKSVIDPFSSPFAIK